MTVCLISLALSNGQHDSTPNYGEPVRALGDGEPVVLSDGDRGGAGGAGEGEELVTSILHPRVNWTKIASSVLEE